MTKIAERAVTEAARPAGVDGDGAAERGPVGEGHIDRQLLVFAAQDLLQAADRDSRLDGDGHVAGG